MFYSWESLGRCDTKGAPMREKMAAEIIDAYNKLGNAFKKREDTHRMAESDKVFAHFARFGNKRK